MDARDVGLGGAREEPVVALSAPDESTRSNQGPNILLPCHDPPFPLHQQSHPRLRLPVRSWHNPVYNECSCDQTVHGEDPGVIFTVFCNALY